MKRQELEDLGLNEEQVNAVMKINGSDIENAKGDAKNLQEEVDGLKGQIKDRDKQLEDLKASAKDNEELSKQIADLQKANADAATAHESELTKLKVDFAVDKALSGAKAKNIKAVKALLDLTDAKLDKEGNVKGLQEQIDKLTSDDSTKFLFETVQAPQFKGFQPGVSAQQKPGANADISKMSYDELTAYMEANPDAQL